MTENKNPTILLCIDTNNLPKNTIEYSCQQAKLHNHDLLILAVIDSSQSSLIFGSKIIRTEKRHQLGKALVKIKNLIIQKHEIEPEYKIREGEISAEIFKEIKAQKDLSMIILGKSKNSLSDNTVLPKIVKRINSKIHIPVTIVPEKRS